MSENRMYIRQCLLYEFQQGHSAAQAVRNICTYVRPKAVSHSTAKYWFDRFRQKDFNLNDTPRPNRTSQIKINRLRELVEADPTRSTRSLSRELSISHVTVKNYINRLGMKFDDGFWVYSTNNEQAYMTNSSRLPISTASHNDSPSFVENLHASTSSALPPISTIQQQSNYYCQS